MLKEANFEAAIVHDLVAAGYREDDAAGYDAARGLFPDDLYAFLEKSQPKEWQTLDKALGNNRKPQVLHDLVKDLDHKGALEVLRHGFKVHGVALNGRPAATLELKTALTGGATTFVHFNRSADGGVLRLGIEGDGTVDSRLEHPKVAA